MLEYLNTLSKWNGNKWEQKYPRFNAGITEFTEA
jgi:hypothetical protein